MINTFAVTNYRGRGKAFGILEDDRRRHMYVLGRSGSGKSTLLENLIVNDIRAGNGVAVVDPHGDLVERLLHFIPKGRINDTVYVNPSDLAFPVAFNVLESVDESQHHLVASGLIAVFKKIWADSWGPRLEYILNNTILALLTHQNATLLGINRMFVDKEYREKVVADVTNPQVLQFWKNEFGSWEQKFRSEATSPIQNKIGAFLAPAIIRNIVGQSRSTINVREIMDSGKILLLNLAKGRVGEDNSALLGAMFITKIQLAAMSRIDMPERERRDFYLYVDEFQNFATSSFATILSEARKYRLCLIVAHQYVAQLDETVRDAVFGNVGTMIAFRVGAEDAEALAKEFDPPFTEGDLTSLANYDFYAKLMIDGRASDPFSATGLPPPVITDSHQEKITRVSRERYARPRSLVEERINAWSNVHP